MESFVVVVRVDAPPVRVDHCGVWVVEHIVAGNVVPTTPDVEMNLVLQHVS